MCLQIDTCDIIMWKVKDAIYRCIRVDAGGQMSNDGGIRNINAFYHVCNNLANRVAQNVVSFIYTLSGTHTTSSGDSQ